MPEREMTMVERCAKAIDAVMHREDDTDPDCSLRYARAVIEAMREPTEEMVEASAAIYGDNYLYRHRYSKDQWQAMVDAALKGEKS